MTNTRVVCAAFLTIVAVQSTSTAAAQGSVAATSIKSKTDMSITGAAGARVNSIAMIGAEVTLVPTVKPGGRATFFTTNLRIDIPGIGARMVPYVIAGGGVANVKERFAITDPGAVPAGLPVIVPPRVVTRSSTDLALTAGGGVDVLLARRLSVVAELRYTRLIGDSDVNVGRFGVGLGYRF